MKGAFASTCVAQGKCILNPRVWHSARMSILKISKKDIGQLGLGGTRASLHARIDQAPLTLWLNAGTSKELISPSSCQNFCPCARPCPYPCGCPYPCPCPCCPLLRSSSAQMQRLKLHHRCLPIARLQWLAIWWLAPGVPGGRANPFPDRQPVGGASIHKYTFSQCPGVTVHIH